MDSNEATILYDVIRLSMKGKGIYAISEDQKKKKVNGATAIEEDLLLVRLGKQH